MKALFILLLACAIFGAGGYYTYELFIRPTVALQEEKNAPATPVPPDPTTPDYNKCVAIRRQGKLIEARKAFQDFIDHFPQSSLIDAAKDQLGEINVQIFLNPVPAPEKQLYVVKSGDVITRVSRTTKSTPELLMKANNLQGTMLRIGQKLYTTPANFSLVLSRRHNKLTVYNDGRFFKQYPIREWPPSIPPYKKGGPPLAKLQGKVIEKISWVDSTRVIFTDKGFANASHWISVTIKHCTLYPKPPAGADPKTVNKPPAGVALDPSATTELAAMLSRGNPVTVE